MEGNSVITEERLSKYLDTTSRALAKVKIAAPPRSHMNRIAEDFYNMAKSYYMDAKSFAREGNYVNAYGAVNYANPDASVANPGGYGAFSYFPPELLMLAMTYMYYGQRDFGIELARKAWHNLICQQGYTWDMPNILRGDVDTGERTFGNDYYQDMMLWSLPAALAGMDVSGPCRPGGLVDRVLAAAAR